MKYMENSVSVIIPVYNRYRLLKAAVESVLEQTVSVDEIIVVDDGSTDETPLIKGYGGIKYIRTEHTGMAGYARNRGVEKASGRFIAFLDSDDIWKPGKIERQLSFFMDNPEIEICHTREIWLRNNKIISQSGQRHKRAGSIFNDALTKCIIGPSTVMMTRSLFLSSGGFREDLEIAEDYELWLRLTASKEVGYIDRPLIVKNAGHGDQLSEKYGQIEIFRIEALGRVIESGLLSPEQMNSARTELVKKCGIYAAGCRKRGKDQEADKYERYAGKIRDFRVPS